MFWSDPDRHREWRPRMREAWERIATDALARVGADDPALGAFIGQRHSELRDSAMAPLSGAISTLGRLRSLGVTLGLITNGGSDRQRAKIERFALTAYFAYIGIEGEVGFGKPHRGAYSLSAREPRCDGSRVLDGRRQARLGRRRGAGCRNPRNLARFHRCGSAAIVDHPTRLRDRLDQ